tara:strand:- start:5772 stop:6146 length:375 start_codon:yes stop_codon:yes gene_type:complete
MKVSEAMRHPHIIKKDLSLSEAARVMSSRGLTSLLFVEDNKLKGIVTERDLLKNFGRRGRISRAMTRRVFTVAPNEDLGNALKIMQKKKIKKLPVVKSGKLVGIVNLTDIASFSDEIGENFFFD